jgi:two-component system cell cycle sensor histidine kinase/response regulator CckA
MFMTKPYKILIMDDDPSILKMMEGLIGRLGYEVRVASDGKQAIKIYQEFYEKGNPFELVILDLVVPNGLSGPETIIELRKINPQVRAVLSSGSIYDSAFINYKRYGFIDIMPKPYGLEDLKHILEYSGN